MKDNNMAISMDVVVRTVIVGEGLTDVSVSYPIKLKAREEQHSDHLLVTRPIMDCITVSLII